MEEKAARRRRTAERWEELISRIRKLEGFQSFLKPLPFSLLREAAKEGPVVILNLSIYGSDALIISFSEPVRVIPLKGLDFGTVSRLSNQLAITIQIARDKRGVKALERVLLDLARQLWHGGMGTVANALTQRQDLDPHRRLHVWWIPTGFLSLLPIHCAGPYNMEDEGIAHLFISSYTAIFSVLLMARKRPTSNIHLADSSARMLAIAVPETSGLSRLRFTEAELQMLTENSSFQNATSFLSGSTATVQAVRTALPNYNWIHVCCHGHWDPEHPLDSAFHLFDGRLTMSSLVQMRLREADFAILSACHTARQTRFLPDESLHLGASLQIAGFRGVLGTVWSMADRDGPELARRFYRHLTLDGRPPDARNAGEALHLAISALRKAGVPLWRWAPFVHSGI